MQRIGARPWPFHSSSSAALSSGGRSPGGAGRRASPEAARPVSSLEPDHWRSR